MENNWIPIIIEGDSQMIIQIDMKLQNGSHSTKVAQSWRLEGHLEKLKGILAEGLEACFIHTRWQGNKVADKLENIGMETLQFIKAKEWDMIVDKMGQDNCMNIMFQDMQCTNVTSRVGQRAGKDNH